MHFDTPEELIDFIQLTNGQNFKYVKWYEGIITSHTWSYDMAIVIHWRGTVEHITSVFELVEMYKKGTISLIKESIEIKYKPFSPITKRKLSKKEYEKLESSTNLNEKTFNDFMKALEMQKKFEDYLREKELETD